MNEKEKYVITLADGTKIDCTLNGNNYITQTAVTEDMFSADKIADVAVDGVKSADRVLRNLWHEENGYHIVFGELTYAEKIERAIDSKIAYLALMSDVDMEGATNE